MVDSQSAIRNSKSPIATITSRQNPLVKQIQLIRDDRNLPVIFLEGARLVQEVVLSSLAIEILVVSEQFPETAFLDPIRARAKQSLRVSDRVFQAITDVDNPQGLLAIVRRPTWTWQDLHKKAPAPYLIFDGLQDPGNSASIIRTAEAAGAAGVVTTPGTAHLFSPRAIRGAMGSSLRLPILEHRPIEEILKELQFVGYALAGTTVQKSQPYDQIDWKKRWAIILGQEGHGVSPQWEVHVKQSIYIPMREPVESLNVAASAAILLYEAARQQG